MKTQTVLSLLAGVAIAVPQPFPPSLLQEPVTPVPSTVDFSMRTSGNYMPSRTSPNGAAPGAVQRRATGEKVSNGNLATHNSGNTKDGNGSGTDSYTYYSGGKYNLEPST